MVVKLPMFFCCADWMGASGLELPLEQSIRDRPRNPVKLQKAITRYERITSAWPTNFTQPTIMNKEIRKPRTMPRLFHFTLGPDRGPYLKSLF